MSTVAGGCRCAIRGGQVGGRDGDGAFVGSEQVDRAVGQRAVGQQRGAADGGHVQDAVDDAVDGGGRGGAQPSIVDALQGVQIGLRVGERRDAGSVRQGAQPVEPLGRDGLSGARMGRGPGSWAGPSGESDTT